MRKYKIKYETFMSQIISADNVQEALKKAETQINSVSGQKVTEKQLESITIIK